MSLGLFEQADQEIETIKVEPTTIHEVAPGLHVVRNSCCTRLKYEVEYGLKRGTTDNCYIFTVTILFMNNSPGAWNDLLNKLKILSG